MKSFTLVAFARLKKDLSKRELKKVAVRFKDELSEEQYLPISKKTFENHHKEHFIDTVVIFDEILQPT